MDWEFEIKNDAKGFTVMPLTHSDETSNSLNWASIAEAIAFKRDLFCVDQVCIVFCSNDGFELEVNEGMKGWNELCQVLPIYLPRTPAWEEWFMQITTRAFELNSILLFRKRLGDEEIGSCNVPVDPELDRLARRTRSLSGCISQADEGLKDYIDHSNT